MQQTKKRFDQNKDIARLLESLAQGGQPKSIAADILALCQRAGLVVQTDNATFALTDLGHASRMRLRQVDSEVGAFRAQHMQLAERDVMLKDELVRVTVNDNESPLAWLARRKGRDGRTLIDGVQFAAGERLRADFTRGQLAPRVTSSWSAPTARSDKAAGGTGEMTDMIVASRQRVRMAMDGVGPEFSGVLLDVCCFLRGLEDVERERGWPARSAKVVLQLALDRLARHYGLAKETRGPRAAHVRTWLAEGVSFGVVESS
ncbi:ATPase involved in DNA replication initiation [Afipia sp. P52-10]|jgi:hypothetical protein|nr:ATPase involved in DNA replication initiation [Afipia sp. P52-10]